MDNKLFCKERKRQGRDFLLMLIFSFQNMFVLSSRRNLKPTISQFVSWKWKEKSPATKFSKLKFPSISLLLLLSRFFLHFNLPSPSLQTENPTSKTKNWISFSLFFEARRVKISISTVYFIKGQSGQKRLNPQNVLSWILIWMHSLRQGSLESDASWSVSLEHTSNKKAWWWVEQIR